MSKVTEGRNRQIGDAIAGGSTVKQQANYWEISEAYVMAICKKQGVTHNRTQGARFKTYDLIADLCNTSETLTALAAKLGVTKQAISLVYKKCQTAGIPVCLRRRGPNPKKDGNKD